MVGEVATLGDSMGDNQEFRENFMMLHMIP